MKTKLFITGLALLAITTLASAQNNRICRRQQSCCTGKSLAFVDANKNGICDNYENRISNVSGGGKNGNFRGCAQGQKQGQGQHGKGKDQGRKLNFIDTDKNGVCDYKEIPSKK